MQDRPAGSLKLRLFNPSQEVDGWQSPHTVVAMLNNDMPFIIDLVTAYLTAQHLSIHRLIHPRPLDMTRTIAEFGAGIRELEDKIELFCHLPGWQIWALGKPNLAKMA